MGCNHRFVAAPNRLFGRILCHGSLPFDAPSSSPRDCDAPARSEVVPELRSRDDGDSFDFDEQLG
jgi:hypothetical protein